MDPFSWKIILCKFDGVDYIHRWFGGVLVWHEPTSLAIHITKEDLPLFLRGMHFADGDQILIAGAGMGSEIWKFSELVGKNGRVVAVEPDSVAFRRLSKLVQLLPYKNVIPVCSAVGRKPERLQLYKFDNQTVTNSVIRGNSNYINAEEVKVEPIESICKNLGIESLNYLKMNIEGFEYEALLGVGSIPVKQYCISCHDFLGEDFKTRLLVTSHLEELGYKITNHPAEPNKPWVGSYVYAKALSKG